MYLSLSHTRTSPESKSLRILVEKKSDFFHLYWGIKNRLFKQFVRLQSLSFCQWLSFWVKSPERSLQSCLLDVTSEPLYTSNLSNTELFRPLKYLLHKSWNFVLLTARSPGPNIVPTCRWVLNKDLLNEMMMGGRQEGRMEERIEGWLLRRQSITLMQHVTRGFSSTWQLRPNAIPLPMISPLQPPLFY